MSRLPEIANPLRKIYPSDLSAREWELLEPLLPKAKGFGHPRDVDLREILNGIFYVQRTGGQWEMMPREVLIFIEGSLFCFNFCPFAYNLLSGRLPSIKIKTLVTSRLASIYNSIWLLSEMAAVLVYGKVFTIEYDVSSEKN